MYNVYLHYLQINSWLKLKVCINLMAGFWGLNLRLQLRSYCEDTRYPTTSISRTSLHLCKITDPPIHTTTMPPPHTSYSTYIYHIYKNLSNSGPDLPPFLFEPMECVAQSLGMGWGWTVGTCCTWLESPHTYPLQHPMRIYQPWSGSSSFSLSLGNAGLSASGNCRNTLYMISTAFFLRYGFVEVIYANNTSNTYTSLYHLGKYQKRS